jgi:heme-degrading monooxygenase HmoA
MYIRTATMKSLDPNDHDRLSKYIRELRSHSMYRPIVEDLIALPGFVKKEYIMREDKEGETFFSTVVFDNKEAFNSYMNSEINQSLWEYLKIMAEAEGISFEMIDTFED